MMNSSFNNNNFNNDNPECSEHSMAITNFCSAVECFKELCPECIENHYKYHKKINTHPNITSIRNIKVKCKEKIKTIIIALNQEIEKCELDYLLDPDRIIKEGISNINLFKEKIVENLNSYCNMLEKNLIKTVNENLLQINDFKNIFDHMKNVIKDLDYMKSKLEKTNKVDSIKKISILDVRHLIEKFRKEIHLVMDTKSIYPINIVINENRLQNYFLKELEKLISLERIPQMNEKEENDNDNEEENKEFTMCTPQKTSNIKGIKVNFIKSSPKSKKYSTLADKQQKQTYHAIDKFNITMGDTFDINEKIKPFLHFFQNNSKDLHLFYLQDLVKKNEVQFEKIQLDIEFNIPNFHKSVNLPNGDLYLVGGTIENLEENNNKSPIIYKYNQKNQCLDIVGKLNYPRSSHAICYSNGYIYVIGGITNNQVILEKCERYSIDKRDINEFCPLNNPVASTCVCSFFQDYLFKFGGICYNNEGESILSQIIEKYDIIRDKWYILNVNVIPMINEQYLSFLSKNKESTNNNNSNGYFGLLSTASCCQINQSEILVLGGYSQNNNGSCQTFSFHIDYSDMESNDNCYINNINRIKLPFDEGFWNNCPVIHDKKLYVLQNIVNNEKDDNCLENERRILEFDSWKWVSYN